MIQDILPRKLINSYSKKNVNDDSIIVIFKNGKFMLSIDTERKTVSYPKCGMLGNDLEYTYLFSIDEEDFFFTRPEGVECPAGFDYFDMKELRKEYLFPKEYVFASYTAFHLIEWYDGTTYCGRCGAKNENSETERARVCPICGKTEYPRINPAVIVGVTNGDKLLLTKYRTGFAHNALVAGFTEIGETVEETVEREVMEETGLHVKNIRYYKSQPWGIASDILLGFYCDVDGDDTISMDEEELKYAEWVSREAIDLQPLEYSLTNEMMKMFKENKNI
jgi:NAD+ diphosphatase